MIKNRPYKYTWKHKSYNKQNSRTNKNLPLVCTSTVANTDNNSTLSRNVLKFNPSSTLRPPL